MPPTTTGGWGFCTGRGCAWIPPNATYSPLYSGFSWVHSARIASMYSSVRRPRSANGAPSAWNSGFR